MLSIRKPCHEPLGTYNRIGVMPNFRNGAEAMSGHAHRMTGQAVSAVQSLITAEERLQQRVRSVLRVSLAAVFFCISGLISIGANVTTAFAKKASSGRGNHPGLRLKRSGTHLKAVYHRHSPRLHHRRGIVSAGRGSGLSTMRGVASWYGNEFHNRKTASGVRFNTNAMMAAHRTLPFGTKVRVTNLANQKSCVVEITDRGPFSHGRIIDVSHAAAEKLGMMDAGIANVQLEIIGTTPSGASQDIASGFYQPASDRLAPIAQKHPSFTMFDIGSDVSAYSGEDAGH